MPSIPIPINPLWLTLVNVVNTFELVLPIIAFAVPVKFEVATVPLNVLLPVNVSVHDLHAAPNSFLASTSFAPPVPPFKTGKGTPLNDTANVPLDVTGLPDTDKKVGTLIATLVTLPVPAPIVVLVSAALNKVIVLLEFTFINLSETLFVKVNNEIPLVVPPKLILAFAASVAPVPPFANGKALPLYVSANVPLVVTGEPLTVNIDGAVKPTLVTVPLPPPPPVYCGIFNVAPTNVAAPLVPVVVNVIAACFPLKEIQSVEDSLPVFTALATGIFTVMVPDVVIGDPLTFTFVPDVPVVKATEVTVPLPPPPPVDDPCILIFVIYANLL